MKKMPKTIKLLISILMILVLLLIVFNIKKLISKPEYEIAQPSNYEEVMESINILKYKNSEVLKVFYGELPVSNITTKLKEVFCEKIPLILEETRNLSEEEVKQYFNENEREILANLRINNSQSFLNMIKEYSNINVDLEKEYDYIEFTKDNNIFGKIVYTNKQEIEFEIQGEYSTNIFLEF